MVEGRFREDLYYRLCVIPIHVPPLRERREDILPLVEHTMSRLAARTGKPIRDISPAALTILYDYDYPGNVRELANVLERAFVLCHGDCIDVTHLPADLAAASEGGSPQGSPHPEVRQDSPEVAAGEATATSGGLSEASAEFGHGPWRLKPSEHKLLSSRDSGSGGVPNSFARSFGSERMRPEVRRLVDALDAHRWNRGATAEALGISRSTLWRRMKEYGLV
jgi:DNA-binding NtrC family response regulator